MTRLFCIFIIAFLSLSNLTLASETKVSDTKIKSWKTFTSDYGYEFKYPDCWTIETDGPDERHTLVKEAHNISVQESKSCSRPLMFPESPSHKNMVGFFGAGLVKTPSQEEVLKDIDRLEKDSVNTIKRKEWLYFKRFKVGADEAYTIVKLHKEIGYTWIFWEMELYCPKYTIQYDGPSIKNPDKSYLDRFKAGDLALPEPEKTIYESIKCVDPKK